MADNTTIEWTESTWNPITGCSKISAGCQNCYAERMASRLQAMRNPRYINGFEVTLHRDLLQLPLKWKKPRLVFVNSMSDLFHEKVPSDFIFAVFDTMKEAKQHTFQILTKRAERLAQMAPSLPWASNIWQGVSVENTDVLNRIDVLRQIPAAVRFLSLEPLLGPLPDLGLEGIDWVIVGGESGPGARPMEAQWVRNIRDQCIVAQVPFFFKQWGGTQKHRNGRVLDGQEWMQYPSVL